MRMLGRTNGHDLFCPRAVPGAGHEQPFRDGALQEGGAEPGQGSHDCGKGGHVMKILDEAGHIAGLADKAQRLAKG